MGTRSLTVVKSKWNADDEWATNATIYRHWDGHPESHGKDIAMFLDGLHLVNGIGQKMPERYANGVGRLAAQLVCFLQEGGHDPDLMSSGAVCGQEYEYHLLCNSQKLTIEMAVYDGPMTFFGGGGENCTNEVFRGTVAEYAEWIEAAVAAD